MRGAGEQDAAICTGDEELDKHRQEGLVPFVGKPRQEGLVPFLGKSRQEGLVPTVGKPR